MLTLEDCIAYCNLTKEEIDAIAEHEHLPEIIALELGNYLVHSEQGVPMIRRMILDDIAVAERHGKELRALQLKAVLRHFIQTHPQA
jgi:hypothetical protein